jgi:hypothetical protein
MKERHVKTRFRPRTGGLVAGLAAGLSLAAAVDARAATYVLDGSNGAVYGSVGDGWFFHSPSQPPPDGVGDAVATPPTVQAVALQTGVVELRALSEYSLAPIAGLSSFNIVSATLSYWVDDVITGFGPGTVFDGTASDPIAVYTYPGDGTIATGDFNPPGLSPVEVVATGLITDSSLGSTGPVRFDVDVSQELKDALSGEDTALGILLGTLDTPTGTSMDGTGLLPIVTVVTLEDAPTYSADERKCQKAVGKAGLNFAKTRQLETAKCLDAVLKATADAKPLAPVEAKCRKGIDGADPDSKVSKARASAASAIAKACESLTPADVDSPCDAGAADFGALATCLVDHHATRADEMIGAEYRRACVILDEVHLAGEFPGLCAQ